MRGCEEEVRRGEGRCQDGEPGVGGCSGHLHHISSITGPDIETLQFTFCWFCNNLEAGKNWSLVYKERVIGSCRFLVSKFVCGAAAQPDRYPRNDSGSLGDPAVFGCCGLADIHLEFTLV